jgi:hypothetical protein
MGKEEVGMQIIAAFRQWWRVQSCRSRLGALDRAAMVQLARDNAIPEADLRQLIIRSNADSVLLPRLLDRLGVAPEQLARRQAAVLRDIAIVCAGCAMTAECRRDLSQQDVPLRHGRYCPNTETIKALRLSSRPTA